MADLNERHPANAPGAFYVDSQCIDCDVCRETAPENITRNEEEGYSYIYKQPENDAEKAQLEEAIANCPVEAIGNDGVAA